MEKTHNRDFLLPILSDSNWLNVKLQSNIKQFFPTGNLGKLFRLAANPFK